MTVGFLFGHLTFALLVFLLIPGVGLAWQLRALLLVAALGLAFVVVDGLSLGDYTRSYTDDLAVTTLLWLVWRSGEKLSGRTLACSKQDWGVVWVFAILALVLYPATLGLTVLDPYRLGFSPAPMLAVLWLLCLWRWWRKYLLAVGLICIATGAWLLDGKASDNYWDYLVDPLLGLYCWGALLRLAWQFRRRGDRAVPQSAG